jgi:hypothetical protein
MKRSKKDVEAIKSRNISTPEAMGRWLPYVSPLQIQVGSRLLRAQRASMCFDLYTLRQEVKQGCIEVLDCLNNVPYEYLKESFRGTLRDTVNRRLKLIHKNAQKLVELLGDIEILATLSGSGNSQSYRNTNDWSFDGKNWDFNREERRLIKSICTRLDYVAEKVLYYSHGKE